MRTAIAIGRLGVAVAISVALAVSAAASAAIPTGAHDFLAYFATQSSLISIAAWALSGAFLLARGPAPAWVHVLRAAAVSYAMVLATCRLVIALPWQPSSGFPLPAANVFINLVAPLLLIADWMLIGDRRPLSQSFLRWVAAYPVLWSTVTLLRGMESGWMPYPLLNPVTAGPRLPLYLGAICLVSLAAGVLTTWMSRRHGLMPLDPAARAVEAVPEPVVPPLDLPAPLDGLPLVPPPPPGVEPAAPLQVFAFVEPPESSAPMQPFSLVEPPSDDPLEPEV